MKANTSKKRRKNRKKSHKSVKTKEPTSPKTPIKSSACRSKLAFLSFRRYLPLITVLSFLFAIMSIVFGVVQCRHSSKSDEKNRELTTANKALIEYNRELLENLITNKYEEDLKVKYPSGYTLFGVDHSRTFKNESIPHRSNLLEEYEFDWSRVRISEVTETTVTIELPNIRYKPLNTKLFGQAMTIPKSPKGQSCKYPVRPEGTKNRIFVEFVEYHDSFYVFAIGFKPE